METAGIGSTCCQALGSSKQDQSSNSLQTEPTGVWLPAGDRSTAVPQGYGSLPSGRAAVSAVSLRHALSCARIVAVEHRHHVTSPLCHCWPGAEKGASPTRYLPLLYLYIFRCSHIVRLYSMPLLAEMPDQGRRLQRRLWACRYILWGMEHGLRLASVDPMCCR